MASQLTATLTPAGPRSVCSPLCAALPEPHDFRIAPCALGYPAPARPQTNTKVQLAGSSDPWLVEFATDSPLEGAGFEPSVPRPIFNGFEAWSELEPIDPKRGGSAEKLRPDQPIGSEGGHSGAGAHAESGGPTEGSRALGDASSEESARTGTPGVAIPPSKMSRRGLTAPGC